MRLRKYLLRCTILIVAFTTLLSSWIKENLVESLFEDSKDELLAFSKVGHERNCYCADLKLQQLNSQRTDNFSTLTTFISSGYLSALLSDDVVPCPISALRCAEKLPLSGSFRLLAMLHSSSEKTPEDDIYRTTVKDALKKSKENEAGTYIPQRGKFELSRSSNLSSSQSIGSGMIFLKNGCVRVSGCRKLGISKLSPLSRKSICSGYTDQTVSNDTTCISEARGHNRMRCHLEQSTKRQFHDYLWVASLGPYYTFQHFIIDKLPELLVARELLMSIPQARFLTIIDRRSLEILDFLGFNRDSIVTADHKKSFCAQNLLLNSPLPGKYGLPLSENFPRPPELFKYASDQFLLKYSRACHRNLIVYLERGKASTSSTHISNIEEVKSLLKRNSRKLKFVSIDASLIKIKDLVSVMQRAKIVVGIHGGQMANIVFAQADKNTSIIEVAGRQTYWKSYYYNGMSSNFDYHLVPRLCKSRGAMLHPNGADLKFKKCSSNIFVSIDDFNLALNKALEF